MLSLQRAPAHKCVHFACTCVHKHVSAWALTQACVHACVLPVRARLLMRTYASVCASGYVCARLHVSEGLSVQSCVRLCACKGTSARVYVCLRLGKRMCKSARAYGKRACVCAFACVHARLCISLWARVCTWASMQACAHVCLLACVLLAQMCKPVQMCVHSCMCLRLRVRVFACGPACAFVRACRFMCFFVQARLLFRGDPGVKTKV